MGFFLLMQGWFIFWKSINIIDHINKLKKKHHVIISIITRKEFDRKLEIKETLSVYGILL